MKIKEQLELQCDIEVPWEVWRAFGKQSKKVLLSGDQASLGEDFMSLLELRTVVDWYADQLGGKVKWEK